MARWNSTSAYLAKRPTRLRAHRQGKITLVTIMAILGMVVLAGLVGNAGHVVTTKVASQNAADAVAFSSAQWMARGMNAVTATNHLTGEITGLVVVLEALGGPEADQKLEDYPLESSMLDKINRQLAKAAPMKGGYGASAFGKADSEFLNLVVNQVSPDSEEKARHKAFATVYDSKMILKRDLRLRLMIKTVANVGFMVPPPFGYATAIAAYGAHALSNIEIAKIGKEWLILQGMELIARNVKPIKVTILEEQLIPALAAHGDFIAGRPRNGSPIKSGIVNAGIADTLEHLGEIYKQEVAIYPGATTFRLPVEAEPAPSMRGSQGKNEPEWGSDAPPVDEPSNLMKKLKDDVDDQKDDIKYRIFQLNQSLMQLQLLENKVDNLLELDPNPTDRAKIVEEINQIRALRAKKQARIRKLQQEMAALDKKIDEMEQTLKAAANLPKESGNLSIKHIPQTRMNQGQERYTQWVRATYPYVDAFRAPVLAQFEEHLSKSKAATHYRKWTDRYTLVKAWQFRSGFRFKAVSKKQGQWGKDAKFEALRMYVMKGSFAQNGTRRDRKGHETWTLASDAGKKLAEEYFTVVGMAHREIEPLFSPVIYPVASDSGITTFSQAVFYNANEQQAGALYPTTPTQAKVGWDTLNWDPSTATPEWGAEPSKSGAKWPWEIFTNSPDLVGTAKVRLNWQAKLMPVTKNRLQDAALSQVTGDMRGNLGLARLFFDKMVTH